MDSLIPQGIEVILPDNDFEKVLYLKEVISKCEHMVECCQKAIDELIDRLEGVDDEIYKVNPIFDSRKTTDILEEKLKQEDPTLWRKCLSITPANAAKIIGDDDLIKLCVRYGGEERTVANSRITLKNMKRYMSDEEYQKYTNVHYKQIGKDVIKR